MIKNLCIVCHPDDELLGAAGTGLKLVDKGESFKVVILSSNVLKRSKKPRSNELIKQIFLVQEFMGFEKPSLGSFPNLEFNNINHHELVSFIEKEIMNYNPHRIFIHHGSDLNDDHRIASKASLVASRYFQRNNSFKSNLNSIYFMEISSSTDWSFEKNDLFKPDTFVDIEKFFKKKLEALSLYKDVMREYPNPRSNIGLEALAKYRGSQSGLILAESFQTVFKTNLL